jgi:hypothetical protein
MFGRDLKIEGSEVEVDEDGYRPILPLYRALDERDPRSSHEEHLSRFLCDTDEPFVTRGRRSG